MLKIKLSRTGKKKQATYRIVVAEAKSKRDGKYSDNLGYYITHTKPSQIKLDIARFDQWVQKGAQPTPTVYSLRQKVNSNELTELPVKPKKKKVKKADK